MGIAFKGAIGTGLAETVIDQAKGGNSPIQNRHRQRYAVREGRITEYDG
jgi:hypothetical protein